MTISVRVLPPGAPDQLEFPNVTVDASVLVDTD
jgi:hypothetical protein